MFEKNKYKKIINNLGINKPLIIFDLKTTGEAIAVDKIIEIAYLKILLNGRVLRDSYFLNPEIEISKEAMELHEITEEKIKGQPAFRDKARELLNLFNDCYYSGYNILNFDLPVLRREFIRANMNFNYSINDIIDIKYIYDFMEPRTLSDTYQYYNQKELSNMHNAESNINASLEILDEQMKRYCETKDIDFINTIHKSFDETNMSHERKIYWRDGQAYLNFSKYRNQSIIEIAKKDQNFLNWIVSSNLSENTKKIVKKFLEKMGKNKD